MFYGYQFSNERHKIYDEFIIYSSGIISEGLYSTSNKKGYGRLVYPNGSYYIGWTYEKKRHEFGTYYKEDQILEGYFRKNEYKGFNSTTD